ncbi:MAG: FHA domain-containing protein [Polyangiaceae bacterium]
MTIRLQYMGHTLEVPEGEFFIGRSTACQLSLDDALVSRKHALLFVENGAATVEDLRSRNGVQVNKKKIARRQPLRDGDIITIGSQDMTIHGLVDRQNRPIYDTITAGDPRLRAANATLPDTGLFEEPTRTHMDQIPGIQSPDKRVHELSLIGAVAEKALQLGRTDDAVRLLDRPLKEMLARAKRVQSGEEANPVDELAIRRGTALALRIAALTQNGEWVDYVIELHATQRILPLAPTIEELHALVRRMRIDVAKLRAYLAILNEQISSMSNNERFLLSRVEGLVELAALK